MKKLFYIVLVAVLLLVIGKFIKQEVPGTNGTKEEAVVETTIDAVIANPTDPNSLNDGEIVGEEAEEVEETNPDETADEDETIVAE